MMLASPIMPAPAMFSAQMSGEESLHYRPAKNIETFKSLLPAPVEFIEGSSSGALAVAEGKYEPINASPKPAKAELPVEAPQPPSSAPSPHKPSAVKPTQSPTRPTDPKSHPPLYQGVIDLTWPPPFRRATGLYNTGNTCFMNSALQCLLHTPPLVRILQQHKPDECQMKAFCMTCGLKQVLLKSFQTKNAFSPSAVGNFLHVIAKHMRKGRQEDTHEFLRYAIDAFQKSCLAGYPPKLDAKIAETTWVHKIFGGRLRSRVKCRSCGHNSDTFDSILDLSLDIFKCDTLRDALKKFVAVDHLNGSDKYKCEKCKKHVNAEKNFTIHEAPLVLTVHLKRFTPLGRKLPHLLFYEDKLPLQPYMSEGSFGPTYSLYGVICHAGGGPNSGHYYAFVKGAEGSWYEANDESITPCNAPRAKKNAYMLFYIQNKGQGLEAAVRAPLNGVNAPAQRTGLAAGMKKRQQPKTKDDEVEEDKGIQLNGGTKFIGPLLPAAEISGSPKNSVDPQATKLKAKIEAAKQSQATKAMAALNEYASDEDEDIGKPIGKDEGKMDVDSNAKRKDGDDDDDRPENQPSSPARPSTPPPSSPAPPPSSDNAPSAVPAERFYAKADKTKKRKLVEHDIDSHRSSKKFHSPVRAHSNGYKSINPFSRPLKKRQRFGI